MSCEKIFLRELRERGFRLTPQREIVLAVMHQIEGLATAEEIYQRVHALSASVDISTVYRTLDLLQDFHLVAEIDPGDGHRRYELLGVHGQHVHLICSVCGEVIGVDIKPFQAMANEIKARYGFEVDLEHLSITGVCQKCAAT